MCQLFHRKINYKYTENLPYFLNEAQRQNILHQARFTVGNAHFYVKLSSLRLLKQGGGVYLAANEIFEGFPFPN